MTHRRAVALMILCSFLWSIAGVVTRQLDEARSFEVTFWRSLFNAAALLLALRWMRGAALWGEIRAGGAALWFSGLCWGVMFTNFMVAITLTTVATVLVTMAVGPLVTAIFSRVFLNHRMPTRTWVAIGVAGIGIAWMFGRHALAGGASLTGALVALGVPLAAAANWTLLQHLHQRHVADPAVKEPQMLPAVLVGALMSAAVMLPLALPFSATPHDLSWLALLGVVQLAVPCLIVVRLTRVLPGPEIALLGLLEVIFGVLLAWVGADEVPRTATLAGGALVLFALLANEGLALRERRGRAQALASGA